MRSWTENQLAAINARGTDILVSAAAGSGKTAALTERVIRRLTDPESPAELSRMLIVTFTNIAAAELKERIGAALDEASARDPSRRSLARQSANIGSAHIGTIHSFCLSMIKEGFPLLGISSSVRVADENESESLALEIMDRIIGRFYSEAEAAGEDPGDSRSFGYLCDTYVTDSDDMLAPIFYDIFKKARNYKEDIGIIDSSSKLLADISSLDFFETPWGKEIRANISSSLSHYERIFAEACSYFSETPELEKKFGPAFSYDYNYILEVIAAAREGYGAMQSAALGYKLVRVGSQSVEEDEKISLYKSARTGFSKFRSGMLKALSAPASDIASQMRESSNLAATLYRLLLAFFESFSEEKRRRGIIDFSDIEHMALRILTDSDGSPSEAARQKALEFDEIYIDEYQDIAPIQDALFDAISRGNRFMVGDVKQCIYAFRGSEPGIFTGYRSRFPKLGREDGTEAPGHTIFLSDNFRCDKSIIDFTNSVFGAIMNEQTESPICYGTDDKLVNSRKNPDGHITEPVRIALLSPCGEDDENSGEALRPGEAEAEYIACEAEKLIRSGRYAPRDIMLLFRNHADDTERFARAFSRHGIPFEARKKIGFFERPHTMLMLSLLRVIDNPERDIPLASVLLSPLGGFTHNELAAVRLWLPPEACEKAVSEDRPSSRSSLRSALARYCEVYGIEKGTRFLGFIGKFRDLSACLSSEKLIMRLLSNTRILYCGGDGTDSFDSYTHAERRRDLMQFYDYAREFEKNSFRGLGALIATIDEQLSRNPHFDFKAEENKESEKVRSMTIHKSKGLEFPVVFLCEAAKEPMRSEKAGMYSLDLELGFCTKLRGASGFSRFEPPMLSAAMLKKQRSVADEELRILYVALTRARDVLYVTGEAKKPDTLISDAALLASHTSRTMLTARLSYMKCILAALEKERINGIKEPSAEFRVIYYSPDGDTAVKTDGTAPAAPAGKNEKSVYNESEKSLSGILKSRLDPAKEIKVAARLPAKLSVSALRPGLLDEELFPTPGEAMLYADRGASSIFGITRAVSEDKPKMKTPVFLEGEAEASTGAERGTATHVFLQFCDFAGISSHGIDSELERMVKGGFITEGMAELVSKPMLERFFGSRLFSELCGAERVYRELRFNVLFPASDFTEDTQKKEQLKSEKLLVQGIIDCLYYGRGGALRLLDYKTDYIKGGSERVRDELLRRYKSQLLCYKKAAREITGDNVERCFIYSLATGDEIDI